MSEMFSYLRDGACCTVVLVKAPAEAVAAALGEPVPVAEAQRGLACEIGSSGWTRVELNSCHDLGLAHEKLRGSEAISLLNEAIAVTRGDTPDTPPCQETPVSTAARLSALLETDAIGIWASDQGPGIGGVAEFSSGDLDSVITIFDAEKQERMLQWHLAEAGDDDEEDFDEEQEDAGEEFEDTEGQHYLWPQNDYADGDFDEVADARIAALGFELELLADPLWSLTEGKVPHESLSACFGIA